MSLRLDRPADVAAFEAAAGSFLAAREAEHNLLLGLCSGIRGGTWRDPYFAVVQGRGGVVAVALRTPPPAAACDVIGATMQPCRS